MDLNPFRPSIDLEFNMDTKDGLTIDTGLVTIQSVIQIDNTVLVRGKIKWIDLLKKLIRKGE